MKKILAIFVMLLAGRTLIANSLVNPAFTGPAQTNFPRPVVVMGPSVNAAECVQVVNSAIWTQCSFRNNCAGMTVMDIRPGIITELNNRGSNNFAVQCQGFIDEAFRAYQAQAGVIHSNFPTGGNAQAAAFPVAAPRSEYESRARELQQMQAMNSANMPMGLTPAAMPQTFDDLSFTERWAIIHEGWQHQAVGQAPLYNKSLHIEKDTVARAREDQAIKDREERAKTLHGEELARQDRENDLEKRRLIAARGEPGSDGWNAWCAFDPVACYAEETARENARLGALKVTNRAAWCAKRPDECITENMATARARGTLCQDFPRTPECLRPPAPVARELTEHERDMRELRERQQIAQTRQQVEQAEERLRRVQGGGAGSGSGDPIVITKPVDSDVDDMANHGFPEGFTVIDMRGVR